MLGNSPSSVDHLFRYYDGANAYDEMFDTLGEPRPHYRDLFAHLAALDPEAFEANRELARLSCLPHEAAERPFPVDAVPRILPSSEWTRIERGLTQRITALNSFLLDVYGPQRILADKVIPESVLYSCRRFRRDLVRALSHHPIPAPVTAFNLVRESSSGDFLVLADHLRRPSGLSCILENRAAMARVFPAFLQPGNILPVDGCLTELGRVLRSLTPRPAGDPVVVLLTPGIHDPAYFEHAFLAQHMGMELVEARDLVAGGDAVCMKTVRGLSRIDVIYRLLEEDSPDAFALRSDSLLGVPALLAAFRSADVAIANHPGSGVAADSSVYPYVPDLIRYYLAQDPILNSVPTWVCSRPQDLAYVLDNLQQLVVKPAYRPDPYGIMVGPAAGRATLRDYRDLLRADPSNYVAQPLLALSRCPAFDKRAGAMAPRHVDLRVFCLSDGERVSVVPGGLTRVALKPGSTVISPQGCASKDTWILRSGC